MYSKLFRQSKVFAHKSKEMSLLTMSHEFDVYSSQLLLSIKGQWVSVYKIKAHSIQKTVHGLSKMINKMKYISLTSNLPNQETAQSY